jgi:hypothetical protein
MQGWPAVKAHCDQCSAHEKDYAGMDWCSCHIKGESNEVRPRLTWQERAELLRQLRQRTTSL